MNIRNLLLVASLTATVMVSCTGGASQKNNTEVVDSDSVALPIDSPKNNIKEKETNGTLGEGTSMNELEIITTHQDTIYIEFNCNMVTGGTQIGDRIHVLYHKTQDGNIGTLAINLTTLQHLWTRVGTNESLELNEQGRLSTYNLKNISYDHWKLDNGQLLLHTPKQVGAENASYTDTFDILQLTADTLVLGKDKAQIVLWREN